MSDRPLEAGRGLPGPRLGRTGPPRKTACRNTDPLGLATLSRTREACGRAIQTPEATAQSAHREAASSSAVASARPMGPGVRPRSVTALRIQDSADHAVGWRDPNRPDERAWTGLVQPFLDGG